jgi:hypothetical protein
VTGCQDQQEGEGSGYGGTREAADSREARPSDCAFPDRLAFCDPLKLITELAECRRVPWAAASPGHS